MTEMLSSLLPFAFYLFFLVLPRDVVNVYGACLTKLGRLGEAEEQLQAGYQGLKASLGDEHERTQKAIASFIELYNASGKQDEAARYRALLRNKETND